MGIELIQAITASPEPSALATILEVHGSSPRHPGSKMLVAAEGILGTVGGGKGEALALEACRRSLAEGRSERLGVAMVGNDVAGPDMVCGGSNTMLIELVRDRAPYREALLRLRRGERVVLVKRLQGPAGPGPIDLAVTLVDQDGAAVCGAPLEPAAAARALAGGQPRFEPETGTFYDPLFPEEKLLILGGGHVAKALAGMAPALGFSVTVVDDRPEFLEPGRFPEGVGTLACGFEAAIAGFPFDAATYAVIMTRGHLLDLACVRAVLGRPFRYAGFMGSGRKTRMILEQVAKDGFDPARIATLWAPIGLDIGAETPAELAVAVLGELIAVRREAPVLGALRAALPGRRA